MLLLQRGLPLALPGGLTEEAPGLGGAGHHPTLGRIIQAARHRLAAQGILNDARPFDAAGQTAALGRMFNFCRTSSIGISIQAQ